jgi:hypothetical protein
MRLGHFHDSIYKSHEYLKIKEYRLFRNSYRVFYGNYRELMKEISKHEKIDLYEFTHSKNGKKKLQRHQLEITRCLHNYLASAFTLIDNTRKQTRVKDNKAFQEEVDSKIKEHFIDNSTAIFIKDLRQFTQHYKMPQVSTTTSFSRTNDNDLDKETKLWITTTHLAGFEWNPASRKIIEDHPKGVEIKEMIKDYYELVTCFQKWYEKRQKSLLKSELAYISKQEKKLKKDQTIFNLNRFFATGSIKKEDFENLLFRHISTFFINKIANSSKDNRVDLILRSLKSLKIKTTNYKDQIETLNNYWP